LLHQAGVFLWQWASVKGQRQGGGDHEPETHSGRAYPTGTDYLDLLLLIDEQLASGEPITYRLAEPGTGRVMRQIAPELAPGMLHAGWLEPSGACNLRRWGDCNTLAGIRA